MKRSNKGIITQQKILQTAKELFYNKGFSDTTVKEICNQSNVKLGTFTYYYSTKEALISDIYVEYVAKIYSYISHVENRKMNSLEKNTIASFVYYEILFNDDNNVKFHYDVLTKLSIFTVLGKNLRGFYSNFAREFNLNIDEKEIIRIFSADCGIRRELILGFIENKMFDSSLDLVATIYIMMGRLFKIDEKIIKEYIKTGIEFLERNDITNIKFLV